MTNDRLDELECWRPDDDTPDDAKVRIDTRDLRDLVSLIPVVRAAMAWRSSLQGYSELYAALCVIGTDEPNVSEHGAGIQSTHPAAEESVVDAPAVTSSVPLTHKACRFCASWEACGEGEWGQCSAIPCGNERTHLIIVHDGYHAVLFTPPDFYCARFDPAVAP